VDICCDSVSLFLSSDCRKITAGQALLSVRRNTENEEEGEKRKKMTHERLERERELGNFFGGKNGLFFVSFLFL